MWLIVIIAALTLAAIAYVLLFTLRLRQHISGHYDDAVRAEIMSSSPPHIAVSFRLEKGLRSACILLITLDRKFAEAAAAMPPDGFAPEPAPDFAAFEPDLDELAERLGVDAPTTEQIETEKRLQFGDLVKLRDRRLRGFMEWGGSFELRAGEPNTLAIPIRPVAPAAGDIAFLIEARLGTLRQALSVRLPCQVGGGTSSFPRA